MALGAFGCGGAAAQQTAENTRLRVAVKELESASQKERRRMRDLEYEIARLSTRLGPTEGRAAGVGEPSSEDVPALPVEVLTPAAGESAAESATELTGGIVRHSADEEFEVVGDDEDGVEIVYVGEAAQDRSVTPDPTYLRSTPPRRAPRAAARRATSTRRRAPSIRRDMLDDRIPVTDEIGPTVARQLAAASRKSGLANPPVGRAAIERPMAKAIAKQIEKPLATPGDAPRQQPEKLAAKAERASDPKAEYTRYFQALRAGNHAFAITGFGHFVERHPRHSYADNALYWLAEAHYDQRAYRVALDAFGKVQREYPRGNKVPDALLKIAYCHIALGETDKARTALTELTERYPKSRPAQLATERLATLGH